MKNFDCYGWYCLRLVTQRLHWNSCTLPCDHAWGEIPCHWRASQCPGLDQVYSTGLLRDWAMLFPAVLNCLSDGKVSQVWQTAWYGRYYATGSTSRKWGYVGQRNIIVCLAGHSHTCCNYYSTWVFTEVWLVSTEHRYSSLMIQYSSLLGLGDLGQYILVVRSVRWKVDISGQPSIQQRRTTVSKRR